jgi:GTP-binding protein EngB required for normal cell division
MPSASENILTLSSLAQELGQESILRELTALQTKLHAGAIYVAMVGQFKRGKSSLINALVGRPLLPADVAPVTSAVTIVRRGESDRAWVQFEHSSPKEIGVAEIVRYATQEHNPGNSRGIRAIVVEVADSPLHPAVQLIDTPGIGSVFGLNSEVTREFIPRIDVAVVVLGSDPPITADENTLVQEMRSLGHLIFYVFNKADKENPNDLQKAEDFTRSVILEARGRTDCVFIRTSALNALRNGCDPGVEELRRLLNLHIAPKAATITHESAERSLKRLIGVLRQTIQLQKKALSLPAEELSARIELFREQTKDIEDLTLAAATRAKENVRYDVEGWKIAREKFLCQSLVALGEQLKTISASKMSRSEFAESIMATTRDHASESGRKWLDWTLDHFHAFEEDYRTIIQRETGRLAERISRSVDDIFGMVGFACEVRPFDAAKPNHAFALKERSLALDLRPMLNGLMRAIAPRSTLERYWRSRSVALAGEWVEENMAAIDQHLVDWVDDARQSLQSQMQNILDESRAIVLTTLSKSQSELHDHQSEASERTATLDEMLARLASLENCTAD